MRKAHGSITQEGLFEVSDLVVKDGEEETGTDGVSPSSVEHDDDELGLSMNSKILSEEEEDRSLRRQSGTDMLIRRLTWARPDAPPATKPTVKSLLDIQKEELSCRGQDRADGT